jgi:hypothetical protein
MDFPPVAPLLQTFSQPTVTDVTGEVRRQWQSSRVAHRIRRGDRVAVAVGSRGIANLAKIVRATLEVPELWVSAPMLEEARRRQDLQVRGELEPLPFDAAGNLEQEKLFPQSVRGRRQVRRAG